MSLLLEELGRLCSATIGFQKNERVGYFTRQNITPNGYHSYYDRFRRLRVVLACQLSGSPHRGQSNHWISALLERNRLHEVISGTSSPPFPFAGCLSGIQGLSAVPQRQPALRRRLRIYPQPRRLRPLFSPMAWAAEERCGGSTVTCSLLARLVSVGVGCEAALKLVIPPCWSNRDESLATVDVCTLDLFTGRAITRQALPTPFSSVRKGGLCGNGYTAGYSPRGQFE